MAYPPKPFDPAPLVALIKRRHPKTDPVTWLSELLTITPITARRILEGKDVWLSQAYEVANRLDVPVKNIFVGRIKP